MRWLSPRGGLSIGSGDVTTGSLLTASITPNPAPLVPTYQWTDDGSNISGATSSTYTVAIGTDGVADASLIRCVVTIDGTPYTSNARRLRHPLGSFAALVDQSFAEDTGVREYEFAAATGTGLTWTYDLVSPPSDVTIDSGTRTIFFDTDALAQQTGTDITVSATDQYGRAATGSPRTFNLDITENLAVNPDFTDLTFADPDPGVPDELTATYTYAGSDTLVFRGITSTSATVPGATRAEELDNIRNGTGSGTLEEFSVNPFSTSNFDLTGLTATSEAATYIHAFIEEETNGGISTIRTTAVSGLDFTAPTLGSLATDSVDGTEVTGTFSEAVYGTEDPADWTINGDTPDSVIISGTSFTADMTSNPIAFGDVVTLSYSGGDIADGDGNPLATISGASVTNNVPSPFDLISVDTATLPISGTSLTRSGLTLPAGDYLVVLSGVFNSPTPANGDWSVTLAGNSAGAPQYSYIPSRFASHFVWRVNVPSATTGDLVISRVASTWSFFRGAVQLLRATANFTLDTAGAAVSNNGAQNAVMDVSQNVGAGSYVIAGVSTSRDEASANVAWAGATEQVFAAGGNTPRLVSIALASNVAAATPRTITATFSGQSATSANGAFSLEVVPA